MWLLVAMYLGKSYYNNTAKLISYILIIISAFAATWIALKYAQDGLWWIKPTNALWTWFLISCVISLIALINTWKWNCNDASCACKTWWRCGIKKRPSSVANDNAWSHAASASTVAAWSAASGKFSETPDNLKKIEWIWPVIETHLNENGIHTFEQLADIEVIRLRNILDSEWDRFINHHPDTRPAQAAMARDGEWDKLKAWQDELDGGRVK